MSRRKGQTVAGSEAEEVVLRRHVRLHLETALKMIRAAYAPIKKRPGLKNSPLGVEIRKAGNRTKKAYLRSEEWAEVILGPRSRGPIQKKVSKKHVASDKLPSESKEEYQKRRRRERRQARADRKRSES